MAITTVRTAFHDELGHTLEHMAGIRLPVQPVAFSGTVLHGITSHSSCASTARRIPRRHDEHDGTMK